MSLRRIVIPAKLGLAILVAWPALCVGLSAVGERVALVQAVAVAGVLPALLGAVTWLRAGQRSHKIFLRKRIFTLSCAVMAISVPLTHWPFKISLWQAQKELAFLTIQAHLGTTTLSKRCGMLRVRSAAQVPMERIPTCLTNT